MRLISSLGNDLATFKYYWIQEKRITINSKRVSFLYLLLCFQHKCYHVEPDGLLVWFCMTAALMVIGCTYSYKNITWAIKSLEKASKKNSNHNFCSTMTLPINHIHSTFAINEVETSTHICFHIWTQITR